MKKYIAEFIGTMVLVILGCGTAMLVGCDAVNGGGYILTAFAFGLVIVGMAYCVGNISGCHINPAVSLGALAGSGVLAAIFSLGGVEDKTGGFGSNGLAGVNGSAVAGLLVEIVLTFIFVLTILGVTSKKAGHGSFAGVVIGFTLTLVHILGIGLTGTSVNPARSIGPAIVAAITGNTGAIACVWVFRSTCWRSTRSCCIQVSRKRKGSVIYNVQTPRRLWLLRCFVYKQQSLVLS